MAPLIRQRFGCSCMASRLPRLGRGIKFWSHFWRPVTMYPSAHTPKPTPGQSPTSSGGTIALPVEQKNGSPIRWGVLLPPMSPMTSTEMPGQASYSY